jgi:hypothetical protein
MRVNGDPKGKTEFQKSWDKQTERKVQDRRGNKENMKHDMEQRVSFPAKFLLDFSRKSQF